MTKTIGIFTAIALAALIAGVALFRGGTGLSKEDFTGTWALASAPTMPRFTVTRDQSGGYVISDVRGLSKEAIRGHKISPTYYPSKDGCLKAYGTRGSPACDEVLVSMIFIDAPSIILFVKLPPGSQFDGQVIKSGYFFSMKVDDPYSNGILIGAVVKM